MKKRLAFIALVFILLALAVVLYIGNIPALIVSLLWIGCIEFLFYRMMTTGRIDSYRSVYFILLAASFILGFRLLVTEGTPALYCHVGIAGNLVQNLYNQFLALANSAWTKFGALSIGFLWLVVILVNGGGFCSWICFFGGIDDFFSRLLPKPLVKLPPSKRFREFQLASLVFFAFVAFFAVEPVFCTWFCPLKVTNAILVPGTPLFLVRTVFYVAIGAVFLVIVPLISKKRFFCSTICPFGAIPPLLSKLNPYAMRIDADKCTMCGKCGDVCPVFAIEKKGEAMAVTRYCTLCGKCADTCERKAISQTLFKKKESMLLPFVSLVIGGSVSLFILPVAVWRAVQWCINIFGFGT